MACLGVTWAQEPTFGGERIEPCPELTMEIIAVMADDDYVTVIWPWEFPDPRAPGQTYRTTGFDTWRFVDGRADEHWDPSQLDAPIAAD